MLVNKYLLQFLGFILVFTLAFTLTGIIYRYVPMNDIEARVLFLMCCVLLDMLFWVWYISKPTININKKINK